MESQFNWQKKIFSNQYNILRNGKPVGNLEENSFSSSATAQLNKERYTFRTKGFFGQHTEIIDEAEQKVIGRIEYNSWMTKATISLDNQVVHWKYDNFWSTSWSLYNQEGVNIKYKSSSTTGEIQANTEDPVLVLSGLFITNYNWQVLLISTLVIFLPIFLN